MRSIDPPRRRSAPRSIVGHDAQGQPVELHFNSITLLLVVKANCVACDELLAAGPSFFDGFDVHYLVADEGASRHFSGRDVVVARAALEALEVHWPPAYLVIDPVAGLVIGEGVVFDAAQVREEINAFKVC
ncbi:MAG TPA: hypothetical protein PLG60_07820 [Acidimicrobiales bacterium]|nr:hypothetical protein [Acidimicrobiales bacterium]